MLKIRENTVWRKSNIKRPEPGNRVKVPGGVNLAAFAESLEIPEKDLVELNPELKAGVTPPDQKEYLLTVPAKKVRLAKRRAPFGSTVNQKAFGEK